MNVERKGKKQMNNSLYVTRLQRALRTRLSPNGQVILGGRRTNPLGLNAPSTVRQERILAIVWVSGEKKKRDLKQKNHLIFISVRHFWNEKSLKGERIPYY